MLIYDVLHKETIHQTIVNDLRNLGVKYRFKKSAFKNERSEGLKNISRKVFKTPLSYQPLDVVNLSSGGIVHVPVFVSQVCTFLEGYATQEGLFRKAGSQLRQKELIARLDNGGLLGEKYHAIDVANCLKSFFRNLPEPLIPYAYHDLFVHCGMLKSCRVQAILLACMLLPPHHLNTLAFFMEFLKKVSLYEKQNKMSTDNLAKVVGPNIMPLQEATMSAVQTRLEMHLIIVKILIENAESIGVLPDHITQTISMETIGSTDNELDVSETQSRSKSRKKKHRSGSLTRKPHLSASNLNLRMFNGLKKIVGKGGMPEENNATENPQVPTNYEPPCGSSVKSTKKRKVLERPEPPSTKKKRAVDKPDKSKKIRLSLDRFVPKSKLKLIDEDAAAYASAFNSCTERRWSSVSNSLDTQRKHRTYSDGSSHLQLILKDNEISSAELQREYNNVFVDANVNLSDDSDEQALLAKEERINANRCHKKLSSSSEELKTIDNFDEMHLYGPKQRLTLNDYETYLSHAQMTQMDDQSEEYVRIPKSEYEEIKNRVSAIESRISQEFGCATNEENNSILAHSVKKVQTAYEKTLEEARIESTTTTDYLARKLGKELKIRRSGEQKIIRSPSARKIGNLRRRSQEKIMSKRVRRTASWHISHGMELQSRTESDQELNNVYPINNQLTFSSNYLKEDTQYLQPRSNSVWSEENGVKLSNIRKQHDGSEHPTKRKNFELNPTEREILQPSKSRGHASVRRVSSFHGNEFLNTSMALDEKLMKLKKSNSQQNILNNACLIKPSPKTDGWRESTVSWKDAEGYFKTTAQINTPVIQTGRASIAKLRAQNAGMVLAKAKLFDECTTKLSTQNVSSKQCEWTNVKNQRSDVTPKCKQEENYESMDQSSKRTEGLYRKSNKGSKSKGTKIMISSNSPCRIKLEAQNLSQDEEEGDINYYQPSQEFGKDKLSSASRQKENAGGKTPPVMKKVPINTLPQDSRLNVYKPDVNALCKTPHIKKPLTVKTPKSAKALVRRSIVDSRRTPLKAVGQLGTPKYQSPKSILKTRNLSRYA